MKTSIIMNRVLIILFIFSSSILTSQVVVCPECNGDGTLECDDCNGYGEYRNYEGSNVTSRCTNCSKNNFLIGISYPHGRGRVKCYECNGIGKISKSINIYRDGNKYMFEFEILGNVGRIRYTDIYISRGDRVVIRSRGQVKLGFFVGSVNTEGMINGGYESYNIVSGAYHGSLLYRIGNANDTWDYVGDRTDIIAKNSGYLELLINDKRL